MESYLKEQYDVIDDKYLSSVDDIKWYFEDNGYEWLDCGQGYATESASKIVHIDGKFYMVHFEAEIESSKQDRGDRLYFVERVKNVSYEEIEKPVEKDTSDTIFIIENYNKNMVEQLLRENGIRFRLEDK